MMSRLGFDALAAAVLALTALLGAYMPALLASRDRLAGGSGRSLPYVLGNMLSAGVMVSAGFCHLLGDAMRMMPKMRVRGRGRRRRQRRCTVPALLLLRRAVASCSCVARCAPRLTLPPPLRPSPRSSRWRPSCAAPATC